MNFIRLWHSRCFLLFFCIQQIDNDFMFISFSIFFSQNKLTTIHNSSRCYCWHFYIFLPIIFVSTCLRLAIRTQNSYYQVPNLWRSALRIRHRTHFQSMPLWDVCIFFNAILSALKLIFVRPFSRLSRFQRCRTMSVKVLNWRNSSCRMNGNSKISSYASSKKTNGLELWCMPWLWPWEFRQPSTIKFVMGLKLYILKLAWLHSDLQNLPACASGSFGKFPETGNFRKIFLPCTKNFTFKQIVYYWYMYR